MPTLLADTKLFLWLTSKFNPAETEFLLKTYSTFTRLIEDSVAESPSQRSRSICLKENDAFRYLFMVIHAVDYSRKDGHLHVGVEFYSQKFSATPQQAAAAAEMVAEMFCAIRRTSRGNRIGCACAAGFDRRKL